MFEYFELHAHSAYSFQRGAATPAQLFEQAQKLGLSGMAILDHDGFYSAPQSAQAAQETGLKAAYGSELTLANGQHLPILVKNLTGYRQLSQSITKHNLRETHKLEPAYQLAEIAQNSQNWLILTGTQHGPLNALWESPIQTEKVETQLKHLLDHFPPEQIALELTLQNRPGDPQRARTLQKLAHKYHLPLVATGVIEGSHIEQRPLLDILHACRLRQPLNQAEAYLPATRGILQSSQKLAELYQNHPNALANAYHLGQEIALDLKLLAPKLPKVQAGNDHTKLRELVKLGAQQRYGSPAENPKAYQVIEHELKIIEQLDFPGYFLIVADIVQYCQSQGILCQGRGSAANSAVCYALGITAVDAVKHQMMFERFLSPLRNEPPDIDLDIESGHRENVIQYVYQKYGRDKAALVANVITYRSRLALKETAFALGYPPAWAEKICAEDRRALHRSDNQLPPQLAQRAKELLNLPRHLGIHPGGMVLADRPLAEIGPLQWATMPGRTVLQWDKEDCAQIGLVKFDLLGLGMLTVLRKSFDQLQKQGVKTKDGKPLGLHNLDTEDPKVYDLLCAADTIGVFQVESRAQMNTLPRLRPRCFYDIVVQVALIRPGPIQGGAVNPYLRRRQGREPVTYLHESLRPALEKTLGVPLFQEQLMKIAMESAGFSATQADQLRRALGAKRCQEKMAELREPLMSGMRQKGIKQAAAEQIYHQLSSFAQYGFPESHAFSFAYIVFASAWLKVHYPELFYASLLSSQPLGFYSSASLVNDAKRHGVKVSPPCVNGSAEETIALENGTAESTCCQAPKQWVQLGLAEIKGLKQATIERILTARAEGQYGSLFDLVSRAKLSSKEIKLLATAGALNHLGCDQRSGIWASGTTLIGEPVGEEWYQPVLPGCELFLPPPQTLKVPSPAELVASDYRSTGLSTRAHPLELVRPVLPAEQILKISQLSTLSSGTRAKVAGLITHRQKPMTAQGIIFLSLEDETGALNVLCSPGFWARYRQVLGFKNGVILRGQCEYDQGALVLLADWAQELKLPISSRSRDFR
ncbi:hypothetical protein BSR29_04155 [Boudabousia liubingyangii]|uniref:Error-prone DNA polymerase n=1 Tax=Boudabousia liubingyangii TaxID=1921764 RepID=A0A1Q5PNB1_9ACTO|nr:error-prone DNA polymerase [Boudabousia liubingyangii]OKL49034.1 hypothetical protein BSR29_04155 [Boudabousia liubingyangii]